MFSPRLIRNGCASTRRTSTVGRRTALVAVAATGLAASALLIPTSASASTSATYVAMGDSFSSGEGNTPYETGSDTSSDQCHRSALAYGSLLAVYRGYTTSAGLPSATFAFPACSGSTTNDLDANNHNYGSEPPQLDSLGAGTKAVTLTIGGNDLGFTDIIEACMDFAPEVFGVPGADSGLPGTWGCSKNALLQNDVTLAFNALAGTGTDVDRSNTPVSSGSILGTPKTDSNGNQIPIHSVASVLASIHAAAPNAHIYLSRYPDGFGSSTGTFLANSHDKQSGYECDVTPPTGFTFDYTDAQWVNNLLDRYAAVEKSAVTALAATGVNVTFVDPTSYFAGHANCDTLDTAANGSPLQPVDTYKWINGISPTGTGSFHPNNNGHALGFEPAFKAAGF